jgi:hypothetical protein
MVLEIIAMYFVSGWVIEHIIPQLDLVQASATVLSISGAFLVASSYSSRRAYGFGIWMVSNLLWVVAGLQGANPYLIVLFGIYFYDRNRQKAHDFSRGMNAVFASP